MGGILETGEVFYGNCAVWQQEYVLLGVMLLLSLVARGQQAFMILAAALVAGFYGFEGYEQFIEGEQCGPYASELNILLAATLIAAAGLALEHQLRSNHK